MFDLTGKRAVVTGSAGGIGQAIAIALAQAGADVAGLDISPTDMTPDTQSAVKEAGRQSLMLRVDMSDAEQVEDAAKQIEAAWGGIDIWVNNAGRVLIKDFV